MTFIMTIRSTQRPLVKTSDKPRILTYQQEGPEIKSNYYSN